MLANLVEEGLGEAGDGVLGGGVAAAAAQRQVARDARYVHDVTPAVLDHARQRRTGGVEEPVEIGLDHGVPLIELELEGVLSDDEPGVVDQRVDSAEGFGEGGDARGGLIR